MLRCAVRQRRQKRSQVKWKLLLVVMTRHGEVVIAAQVSDDVGRVRERERERYPLVYGAKILKKEAVRFGNALSVAPGNAAPVAEAG